MLPLRERGEAYDQTAFATRGRRAVAEIVRKQAAIGLDIVADGEQLKLSFVSYVNHRRGGAARGNVNRNPWGGSREVEAFPEFYQPIAGPSRSPQMLCVGPIPYIGQEQLKTDIETLKASVEGLPVAEASKRLW